VSSLKVFNTLSNQKEEFVPLNGKRVLYYGCGPTVYDASHLGHARCFITYDVVRRYLSFSGYDVTFVRNITDVDDKIIKRAKERGVRPEVVARENTYTFWRDMAALNVEWPDLEPRCTEFIGQMIEFIKVLIDKKHAYAAGGDVYFDVASFKDYGQLKKQSIEDMMVGAREDQVRSQDELIERKRAPADFALWKGAAEDEPGWESPWGRGRPGWHIECSAMVKNVLGETIDIHGGGLDLIFPHHENEKAQSEAAQGKRLAKYWMHNNFLQVESEKMSKSLGNFRTIHNVLTMYSPDAVRMFLLQTHYRSPIDMTEEVMNAARNATLRLIRAVRLGEENNGDGAGAAHGTVQDLVKNDPELQAFLNDFVDAMNDDFHTPQAVSILFALADKAFAAAPAEAHKYGKLLKHLAGVLGFTLEDTAHNIDTLTGQQVMDLVLSLRKTAREKKDFQMSDQIRDGLQQLGIKIMDSKGGDSTWERL
jgi:cysteinyl-tRNA synthetase